MNLIEYKLICLQEECNEIAYTISKILRFGIDEEYPGYGRNRIRLVSELNDLEALVEILQEANIELPGLHDRRAISKKKQKHEHYVLYALKCGTIKLEPSP